MARPPRSSQTLTHEDEEYTNNVYSTTTTVGERKHADAADLFACSRVVTWFVSLATSASSRFTAALDLLCRLPASSAFLPDRFNARSAAFTASSRSLQPCDKVVDQQIAQHAQRAACRLTVAQHSCATQQPQFQSGCTKFALGAKRFAELCDS